MSAAHLVGYAGAVLERVQEPRAAQRPLRPFLYQQDRGTASALTSGMRTAARRTHHLRAFGSRPTSRWDQCQQLGPAQQAHTSIVVYADDDAVPELSPNNKNQGQPRQSTSVMMGSTMLLRLSCRLACSHTTSSISFSLSARRLRAHQTLMARHVKAKQSSASIVERSQQPMPRCEQY